MKLPKLEKWLIVELIALVLLAGYVGFFRPIALQARTDLNVGYADWIECIRAFDETLAGRVVFKDFYWGYGPFFLYAQLLPYVLFGKNHNALAFDFYSFLPFCSIVLSYAWARVFFRSGAFRFLFLLVCIGQGVNCVYPSLRHITAEFALASFVLWLTRPQWSKKAWLVGTLAALAILMSPEYGLSALLTMAASSFFLYGIKTGTEMKRAAKLFFLGFIVLFASYCSYLAYHGAFLEYFNFTFRYIQNFKNPAIGEFLPVLPALSFKNALDFLNSAEAVLLSRALRFYLPPLFYVFGSTFFAFRFLKLRRAGDIPIFLLFFYGLIIYGRTLAGPDYNYLTYGLVPAITLGLLALQNLLERFLQACRERKAFAAASMFLVLASSLAWLAATFESRDLLMFRYNLNISKRLAESAKNKMMFDKVGYPVTKKSVDQYESIDQYIESHTRPNEPFFVYPWGPYNHFTGRPSPMRIRDSYDLMAGPFVMREAVQQLDAAKPNFVILNTYNNSGTVTIGSRRGDVDDYASWGTPDSPCFADKGNDLESYILGNYSLVKTFDYAAVLQRRKKSLVFHREFQDEYSLSGSTEHPRMDLTGALAADGKDIFKITGRTAKIRFIFDGTEMASHVDLAFTLKAGLTKFLISKSRITLIVETKSGISLEKIDYVDLTRFGRALEIWGGLDKAALVDSVSVVIETPPPYLLPDQLEIKDLRLLLEDKEILRKRYVAATGFNFVGSPHRSP